MVIFRTHESQRLFLLIATLESLIPVKYEQTN